MLDLKRTRTEISVPPIRFSEEVAAKIDRHAQAKLNGASRNGAPTRDTPPGDSYENAPLVNLVHAERPGDKCARRCARCAARFGQQYPARHQWAEDSHRRTG